MINISWHHAAADAQAFASLLPKTLDGIERWAYPVGNLDTDGFGPFYRVKIREGIKAPVSPEASWLLRPATLRLGAMKALQDAPSWWSGFDQELTQMFINIGGHQMGGTMSHQPAAWYPTTLDLMVQLAWFREVWFA